MLLRIDSPSEIVDCGYNILVVVFDNVQRYIRHAGNLESSKGVIVGTSCMYALMNVKNPDDGTAEKLKKFLENNDNENARGPTPCYTVPQVKANTGLVLEKNDDEKEAYDSVAERAFAVLCMLSQGEQPNFSRASWKSLIQCLMPDYNIPHEQVGLQSGPFGILEIKATDKETVKRVLKEFVYKKCSRNGDLLNEHSPLLVSVDEALYSIIRKLQFEDDEYRVLLKNVYFVPGMFHEQLNMIRNLINAFAGSGIVEVAKIYNIVKDIDNIILNKGYKFTRGRHFVSELGFQLLDLLLAKFLETNSQASRTVLANTQQLTAHAKSVLQRLSNDNNGRKFFSQSQYLEYSNSWNDDEIKSKMRQNYQAVSEWMDTVDNKSSTFRHYLALFKSCMDLIVMNVSVRIGSFDGINASIKGTVKLCMAGNKYVYVGC